MPAAPPDALFHVLLALTAVIVVGQLLSRALGRIGQPPVIGEVAAGILLGPSLIGLRASSLVLPPAVAPYLGVIAQLGVVLYMFLVGLDLPLPELRARARATIATSVASIVVPFLLGALPSIALYPRVSSSDVPFTSFVLFIGVALSITAFPVLARILTDRGLARTELGMLALTAAAINDVAAWCLLAVVVGIARAEPGNGVRVAVLATAYIGLLLFLARPVRALRCARPDPPAQAAAAMFVALSFRPVTERIGIHAIFGAFLLGAIVPHDSSAARTLNAQMRISSPCCAPGLFRLHGDADADRPLATGTDWLLAGSPRCRDGRKPGGALAAARLGGMPVRCAVPGR